jgi:DNA-binding transcriptional regulator YiaG
MTSFAATLKSEIIRLSRKELRAQVEPLRKASSAYRKDIAALKREVALLQRQVASVSKTSARAVSPTAEAKPIRFAAKGLKALRARLGVSAGDFGKLAGASGQSVYNWENGKTVPRQSQLTVLAELRDLSKKEAHARLDQSAKKPVKKKRASKR